MRPEIKAKWLDALRNKGYKKGKGYLNASGCMCAFGVLCDLYSQEKPSGADDLWKPFGPYIFGFGVNHIIRQPPQFVLEWAGLDYDGIKSSGAHPVNQIMGRNDGVSGHSEHDFEALASFIEVTV